MFLVFITLLIWQAVNLSHGESSFYRIVTIHNPPFVYAESRNPMEWHGYLIDMLKELSNRMKFIYDLYLVPDGHYGKRDPVTGQWLGIVGELINKTAHFALAPLTVTLERLEYIDYSMPYMHTGIAIMYRIPEPGKPLPFRNVNELINTDIKYGPLRGGATFNFFTKSTYNLYSEMGSYINTYHHELPVSMESAVNKTLNESFAFLGESSMIDFHIAQPPCSLVRIGDNLNSIGYALGFPKNSSAAVSFSKHILGMAEDGSLDRMRQQWWINRCKKQPKLCVCGGPICTTQDEENKSSIKGHSVAVIVFALTCALHMFT